MKIFNPIFVEQANLKANVMEGLNLQPTARAITVDSPNSKFTFDDGFWVDTFPSHYLLSIFISNPLYLISKDDIFDLEARKRFRSNNNQTLFPFPILSALSLSQENIAPCIALKIKILKRDLSIFDISYSLEVVAIQANLAFNDPKTCQHPIYLLAQNLFSKLVLYNSTVKQLSSKRIEEPRYLVNSIMSLANALWARFALFHDIFLLWLDRDNWNNPFTIEPQYFYNKFFYYANFTNPLRIYSNTVNVMAISHYLKTQTPLFSFDEITDLAQTLSQNRLCLTKKKLKDRFLREKGSSLIIDHRWRIKDIVSAIIFYEVIPPNLMEWVEKNEYLLLTFLNILSSHLKDNLHFTLIDTGTGFKGYFTIYGNPQPMGYAPSEKGVKRICLKGWLKTLSENVKFKQSS